MQSSQQTFRRLLVLGVYSALFILAFIGAPNYTTPLITEIQCFQPNQTLNTKLCAYCWKRPKDLNPLRPVTISFPAPSAHLILTQSCLNYTCKDALQQFDNDDPIRLQQLPEIDQFMKDSNSTIQKSLVNGMQIDPRYKSWKMLVETSSLITPVVNDFYYSSNERLQYYIIVEGVILAITVVICIFTTFVAINSVKNKVMAIFACLTMITFYLADALIDNTMVSTLVTGLGKSMLVFFVINSISVPSKYLVFSIVASLMVIVFSLYDALATRSASVSDVFLFIVCGVIIQKVLFRRHQCGFEIIAGILGLSVFATASLLAELNDSHVWELLRITTLGVILSLLQMNGISVVNFQAFQQNRPYSPHPNDDGMEGMVQIQDTSVI